jgi:predicted ATPase
MDRGQKNTLQAGMKRWGSVVGLWGRHRQKLTRSRFEMARPKSLFHVKHLARTGAELDALHWVVHRGEDGPVIRRFETRNFRMMRANSVSLGPFVAMVGKNATGKSTFLSALRFVADLVKGGVDPAMSNALERDAPNFSELCFDPTKPVEFALDLDVRDLDAPSEPVRFRYEVQVGPRLDGKVVILEENLFRRERADDPELTGQLSLGDSSWDPERIHPVGAKRGKNWRKVVGKTHEGKDYFRDEKTNWNSMFQFGAERSALGSLPEDRERFPMALRIRDALRDGVSMIELDGGRLREPSLPRAPVRLLPDGSNLARAAQSLHERDPVLFSEWIQHVGTAVEGLEGVDLWERPEDKRVVLRAHFRGSHAEPVPSWLLSDGTLRLLALTLISYDADAHESLTLIEEPENGLHPLAMQAVWQALSQPGDGGQVLVATHSPVFLAQVSISQTLVFRRQPDGSALVRRGDEVPELKTWHESLAVADIFATGVLA